MNGIRPHTFTAALALMVLPLAASGIRADGDTVAIRDSANERYFSGDGKSALEILAQETDPELVRLREKISAVVEATTAAQMAESQGRTNAAARNWGKVLGLESDEMNRYRIEAARHTNQKVSPPALPTDLLDIAMDRYAAGDGKAAIDLLLKETDPAAVKLREKIRQVVDLVTKLQLDSTHVEDTRSIWRRVLKLETDPENAYHIEALRRLGTAVAPGEDLAELERNYDQALRWAYETVHERLEAGDPAGARAILDREFLQKLIALREQVEGKPKEPGK